MTRIHGPIDYRAVRAWNLANLRARLDYYAHPSTACLRCGEPTADAYCADCQRERMADAKRLRAKSRPRKKAS